MLVIRFDVSQQLGIQLLSIAQNLEFSSDEVMWSHYSPFISSLTAIIVFTSVFKSFEYLRSLTKTSQWRNRYRLTLSNADKQARDWFVETTKDLGCIVNMDTIGTLRSQPHLK